MKNTKLDLQEEFLAGVFAKFFKGFYRCLESVFCHKEAFNTYNQPLRIVFADFPEYITDDVRPLADYDNLEGDPFWLR